MKRKKIDPKQKWPLKAYNNSEFLSSEAARSIRVLCEMTEPSYRINEEKISDTIVLFGSTRIQPLEKAKAYLSKVESEIYDPDTCTPEESSALLKARRGVKSATYYTAAVELADELTKSVYASNPAPKASSR